MASHNSPDVYQFEKILRHKDKPWGTLYLVKWKGYSEKHNSWEPQENFAPKDIEDYMGLQTKNLIKRIEKSEAMWIEKKAYQQSKLAALEKQVKEREERILRRKMRTT